MTLTANEFLARLEARQVHLFVSDVGDLCYRAPIGVVTPIVAARIAEAAPMLVDLLKPAPAAVDDTELIALGKEADAAIRATLDQWTVALAYAAFADILPSEGHVLLAAGTIATNPRQSAQTTFQRADTFRQKHGPDWFKRTDGQIVAQDIETLAQWWHCCKKGAEW